MQRQQSQPENHQDLWDAIHKTNLVQAKAEVKQDMIIDTLRKLESKIDEIKVSIDGMPSKQDYEALSTRIITLENDKKMIVDTTIKTTLRWIVPIIIFTAILLSLLPKFMPSF